MKIIALLHDEYLSDNREIKASYQGMSLRPAARQLPS
jgi:hypothetical protein